MSRGYVQGSGQRGGLDGLPTPWVVLCAGRMRSKYPAFTANTCFCSRHFKSGSWVFWSLGIFFVQNLPQLHMPRVIFSPYSFFVFHCWRRGVSGCKHCSKGPRSQPVSLLCSALSRSALMDFPKGSVGLYYDPHFTDGIVEFPSITPLVAPGHNGQIWNQDGGIQPPLLWSQGMSSNWLVHFCLQCCGPGVDLFLILDPLHTHAWELRS